MKKIKGFIITLAMLLFVTTAFAQAPVKIYYSDDTGSETAVSPANPLPVTGSFVITGVATETTLAQILAEMTNPDTRAWILNWPSSYPVTGTFWQETQPVSGTFYQATQPVSGTFYQDIQPVSLTDKASVDTGLLTDTIQMDSGTINPYSEITKTYTNVKWIQAKARTGIDVRVSTGTGSSTSTTYDVISAGERWRLPNLHAIASLVVKFMGNSATSSDTGIIQISYGQ